MTRITKGVIKPNEDYQLNIVTSTKLDVNGDADISGNLSVGGVLTYEDVTSIDSVGIITAQKDIHVGAGVSIVGIVTAATGDFVDLDVDGHTNLDNVSISGVTTIGDVVVGGATTDLIVNGNARVTGILSVGTGTVVIDETTVKTGTSNVHSIGIEIKGITFLVQIHLLELVRQFIIWSSSLYWYCDCWCILWRWTTYLESLLQVLVRLVV